MQSPFLDYLFIFHSSLRYYFCFVFYSEEHFLRDSQFDCGRRGIFIFQ